jgi:hypothetical protein
MSRLREGPITGGKFKKYAIRNGTRIICDDAFRNCKMMEEIYIPSSVNFIGEEAFSGCTKLSNIKLPNSITYIGNDAFDCYEGNIILPESLEILNGNPFCPGCKISSLSNKYVVVDDVVFTADMHKLVSYCKKGSQVYSIPKGVITVGSHAFRSSELHNIVFPDTVEIIEAEAFMNNDYHYIKLPSSLKKISRSAFSSSNVGCLEFMSKVEFTEDSLKHLTFEPDYNIIKVPSLYLDYYKNSIYSDVIYITDEDIVFEGGWILNHDKSELLSSYEYKVSDYYVIPDGVVKIGSKALYNIPIYKGKIRFPKSIKWIMDDALLEDSDLELSVPKGTLDWYVSTLPAFKENFIEEDDL